MARSGIRGSDGTEEIMEFDFQEDVAGFTFLPHSEHNVKETEEQVWDSGSGEGANVPRRRHRPRRQGSCPGGVGGYGFNTFNFLTFALQVFNGVLNVVNNINNNNNNNNANNLNNVAISTDQVVTNSNRSNNVIVIIPPPRRRHHHLPSCNAFNRSAAAFHAASALLS